MRKKISSTAYYKRNFQEEELNKIAEQNYENNLSHIYSIGENIDSFNFMNEKAEIVKESIHNFFSQYKELKMLKKESTKNSNQISRTMSKKQSRNPSIVKLNNIIDNKLLKISKPKFRIVQPKRIQSSIQLKLLKNNLPNNSQIKNKDVNKDVIKESNKVSSKDNLKSKEKFIVRKRSFSMQNLNKYKDLGFKFNQSKVPLNNNIEIDNIKRNSNNKDPLEVKLHMPSNKSSNDVLNQNNQYDKSSSLFIQNKSMNTSNLEKIHQTILSQSPDNKQNNLTIKSILKKQKDSAESNGDIPNILDNKENEDKNVFDDDEEDNEDNEEIEDNDNDNKQDDEQNINEEIQEDQKMSATEKKALFRRKRTLNASNINIENKENIELFREPNHDSRIIQIIDKVYDSLSDDETNLNFEDYSYLIHPDSPFKQILDFIVLFDILIFTLSIPVNLTLEFDDLSYFKVIDIFSDLVLLVSIISMFFTPFLNENLQLIFDKKIIMKNYFSFYFIIDLIVAIPINSIFNFYNLDASYTQMFRLVRLLKFFFTNNLSFKVLKKIFFVRYFKQKLITSTNKYGIIVQFGKFLLNFFICIHVVACFYIFLAKMRPQSNWINNKDLQDSNFGTIYLASIYFHFVTIFTVGYGDIRSITMPELIYNSMFLIVGIGIYSLTVSFLSKFSIDDPKTKSLNKNVEYLRFLDFNFLIPKKIFNKALRLIRNDDEVIRKEKISLIDELPANLKQELIIQSHREVFENFKFFKNLGNKKEFISKVIQVMKPAMSYKGDILIEEEQIIEETIFIKQGVLSLDINYKNVNVSVICIRRNEHFGDSLMMLHKPSPISARVKSKYIEIYLLRKFDFIYILFDYPVIFDTIFEKGTRNLMILEKEIELKKNIIDTMYPNAVEDENMKPSNSSISSFDYFSNNKQHNNNTILKQMKNKNFSQLSVVPENASESGIFKESRDIIPLSKKMNNSGIDISQNNESNIIRKEKRLSSSSQKKIINFNTDKHKNRHTHSNHMNKDLKNNEFFNKMHKSDIVLEEHSKSQVFNNKLNAIEKLSSVQNIKNNKANNSSDVITNSKLLKKTKLNNFSIDNNSKCKLTSNNSMAVSDSLINKSEVEKHVKDKNKNFLMKQLNINMENSTQQLLDSENYFSEYFSKIMANASKNKADYNINKERKDKNSNELDTNNRLDKLEIKLKKTFSDNNINNN